jgi:hypothetical protein
MECFAPSGGHYDMSEPLQHDEPIDEMSLFFYILDGIDNVSKLCFRKTRHKISQILAFNFFHSFQVWIAMVVWSKENARGI